MNIESKDRARFWTKIVLGTPAECWEWGAYRNKKGYGLFGLAGKNQLAHRVAYEIAHGEIPIGLEVCHTCDTPSCCNPAHLFLGTHVENMADMVSKGRQAQGDQHIATMLRVAARGDQNGSRTHPERMGRPGEQNGSRLHPELLACGEQNGGAKLTEPQAREILALKGTGLSQSTVAARFEISFQQVSRIWLGKSWKHLGTGIGP